MSAMSPSVFDVDGATEAVTWRRVDPTDWTEADPNTLVKSITASGTGVLTVVSEGFTAAAGYVVTGTGDFTGYRAYAPLLYDDGSAVLGGDSFILLTRLEVSAPTSKAALYFALGVCEDPDATGQAAIKLCGSYVGYSTTSANLRIGVTCAGSATFTDSAHVAGQGSLLVTGTRFGAANVIGLDGSGVRQTDQSRNSNVNAGASTALSIEVQIGTPTAGTAGTEDNDIKVRPYYAVVKLPAP